MNITKPTLLLDEKKVRKNIQKMVSKARHHGLDFRPHFKTHQSLEIARWFREHGVDKITVSSVDMARYFSAEWNDISLAFPVNIREIDEINELARNIRLNLLVESAEVVEFLDKNIRQSVGIFLKIDVGYHRTGIDPANSQAIEHIIGQLSQSPRLVFKGFLAHAGHTYQCRGEEEIKEVHRRSLGLLFPLKKKYPESIISLGDTPSCSVADTYEGVDEIRPGNFVFYDLTQNQIGSNSLEEIAVALACPIVALHPDRNEIILYGGGVHFSKDRMRDKEYGTIYGKVVENKGHAWGNPIPGMYVSKLSQEHGTVKTHEAELKKYKVGDILMILPVHSCMMAYAMGGYISLEGRKIERNNKH